MNITSYRSLSHRSSISVGMDQMMVWWIRDANAFSFIHWSSDFLTTCPSMAHFISYEITYHMFSGWSSVWRSGPSWWLAIARLFASFCSSWPVLQHWTCPQLKIERSETCRPVSDTNSNGTWLRHWEKEWVRLRLWVQPHGKQGSMGGARPVSQIFTDLQCTSVTLYAATPHFFYRFHLV